MALPLSEWLGSRPLTGRRSRLAVSPPLSVLPAPAAEPPAGAFFLPTPDRSDACLLIHGSAGHPGHLRPLGEHLHREGYTVQGIALPGHDVQPADMAGIDWKSCYAAVRDSWRALRSEYRRVHVIGFSFGGALALHLAAREQVDDLVLLAPALYVHFRLRGVLVALHGLVPGTPARDRLLWYAGLGYFLRVVARDLERVDCPLLAIHARDDRCVRVKSSVTITARMRRRDSRLAILPRGGHLLPLGEARREVCGEVSRHLARHRVGPALGMAR
ncbi:MAG TPA: alpha/beta fold hydrolase [Candidatus Udaeobacter sp.]|nr:alpha/beta fold hydrolase [Candidatus Udaeobacter sp.]